VIIILFNYGVWIKLGVIYAFGIMENPLKKPITRVTTTGPI